MTEFSYAILKQRLFSLKNQKLDFMTESEKEEYWKNLRELEFDITDSGFEVSTLNADVEKMLNPTRRKS